MPPQKRQRVHLRNLAIKRRRNEARVDINTEQQPVPLAEDNAADSEPLWDAHWEGLSEDESDDSQDEALDVEVPLQAILSDMERTEGNVPNSLTELTGPKDWSKIQGPAFSTGSRQQGPDMSERTQRRKRAVAKDLSKEARTIQPLSKWFTGGTAPKTEESDGDKRERALYELKRLLGKKNHGLEGQTLKRHELVLQLMYSTRSRRSDETRKGIAFNIARGYGRGKYLSTMMLKWERSWIETRKIGDDQRGLKTALRSWLNDEGTVLAARAYIAQAGPSRLP